MFGIEPYIVLQKPFSSVISACRLAVISNQTSEANQQAYVNQEPQYSQTGSQYNARGDPERMIETAIIPLGGLAENKRATSALQDVIDRFK